VVVSVGMASNQFSAKIASDLEKPVTWKSPWRWRSSIRSGQPNPCIDDVRHTIRTDRLFQERQRMYKALCSNVLMELRSSSRYDHSVGDRAQNRSARYGAAPRKRNCDHVFPLRLSRRDSDPDQ